MVEKGSVVMGIDTSKLISIDSSCAAQFELVAELSRPKRIYTNDGKIKVESKKEMKARNVTSPNLFDACKMAFAVRTVSLRKASNRIKTRSIRVRDRGVGM
jgi:hypothetical protein